MMMTFENLLIISIGFFLLYLIFKKLLNLSPSSLSPVKTIPICPKCANTEIEPIYTGRKRHYRNPLGKYRCPNCKYVGICPEIEADKADQLRKDIENLKDSEK